VLDFLPKDTSYGQRQYQTPDGSFKTTLNVVMMGTDRTSCTNRNSVGWTGLGH
jgi:hypothetical protein